MPTFSISELFTMGALVVSLTTIVITNKNTSNFLKEKMISIEKKQEKHNNILERTYRVEESCKVAHNRITDQHETLKNIDNKVDKILDSMNDHVKDYHFQR